MSNKIITLDELGAGLRAAKSHSEKAVEAHAEKDVYGENGVHGIRYFNDELQAQDESGEWVTIESGGGSGEGVAPDNCADIRIRADDGKVTLFWSDPQDTIVDGKLVSVWKGTKVVMKTEGFPQSADDGTLLWDNRIRDQYKETGFEVTGLTNGTTYYFALFPYSSADVVNMSADNRISGVPQSYKIMTVNIDLSNSNPSTCCTYADDAVGMIAGGEDWDTFFGHYPCLFKDGAEVGKLNRDNFDQFEDGSAADISSGNAGDAMIAFPRRGLKISTAGDILTVSMTDNPDSPDFGYLAHERGTTRKEAFYLGVYKGWVSSSRLRSLKGKSITAYQTIGQFRTQAQANGSGYEQSAFYQLVFRQSMLLLKYKSLDSQTAVGTGCVNGSSVLATGGTEAWGMDCELIKRSNPTYLTDQRHHVKCFGLEDCWGNVWEWIDGLVSDRSRNILTANINFNDTGSGYTNNGNGGVTADIKNYMSKPQGTTEAGFVAKEFSGSHTTYFCDHVYLCASTVPYFGGNYFSAQNDDAGAFSLYLKDSASFTTDTVATRLMYL